MVIDELNGNALLTIQSNNTSMKGSTSGDDLSQSLSEYTDADENGSMSAPTEYLAEFLAAVMGKDYPKALTYCRLILKYEPNNVTAKEFFPLIVEKVKLGFLRSSSESENSNYAWSASSPENDLSSTSESDGGSDASDSDSSHSNDSEEKELDIPSNQSPEGSGSDNTSHSYSSLLLEEDDFVVPALNAIQQQKSSNYLQLDTNDDDIFNGNVFTPSSGSFGVSSTAIGDSDPLTEPLT